MAGKEIHHLGVVVRYTWHLRSLTPERFSIAKACTPMVERPLGPRIGSKTRVVIVHAYAVGGAILQLQCIGRQLCCKLGQFQLTAR